MWSSKKIEYIVLRSLYSMAYQTLPNIMMIHICV